MGLSGIKGLISAIVKGVIIGFTYYVVYLYILPLAITTVFRGFTVSYFPIPTTTYLAGLCIFVGLWVAISLLKDHPISLPLKLFSKVFGALLLLALLNFGLIEGVVTVAGMEVNFRMDISVLLYSILLFSMLTFP